MIEGDKSWRVCFYHGKTICVNLFASGGDVPNPESADMDEKDDTVIRVYAIVVAEKWVES